WNEFECGSNYARSMASYSLLNAFSGFEYNLVEHRIGFNPQRIIDGNFTAFWSLGSGWGTFVMEPGRLQLILLGGELCLDVIGLPASVGKSVEQVQLDGCELIYTIRGQALLFDSRVDMK